MTEFWVLKVPVTDGRPMLSALSEEGIDAYEYDEGIRLADRHPRGRLSTMYYDPHWPAEGGMLDFVPCIDNVLIASPRAQDVIASLCPADRVEFLPIWIADHADQVVAKDYAIVNLLGGEGIIDMKRSEYRMGHLIEDQIKRIKRLVVDEAAVKPGVGVFRATDKLGEYFATDEARTAFEAAGLAGWTALPADGWDGLDF